MVSIYIDEAKINSVAMRDAAEVDPIYLRNPDPRAKGLTHGEVSSAEHFDHRSSNYYGSNFLIFDQNSATLDPAYKLKIGQNNTISGDLISYTFKGAAEYNGLPADVVFTYSNLNIVLQSNMSDDNYKELDRFSIGGGNSIQLAATRKDSSGNVSYSEYGKDQRYGISVDVNVKVMQNGALVPGDFYFRMVDIDVKRTGTDSFETLYNASGCNNYSERVQLRSGFKTNDPISGTEKYAVYIPGGNSDNANKDTDGDRRGYKIDISHDDTNHTYMFEPLLEDTYSHPVNNLQGTFYSGFMTVADNTNGGVNLTCWAAGAGNAPINSSLLAGFQGNEGIVHKVISSTGDGGTIQTTTNRNLNGRLDDGGTQMPPGSVSVPNGKEIVYTLIPDTTRCTPQSVLVTGTESVGALQPVTLPDGTAAWTYRFTGVTTDQTIQVIWDHPPYKETYRYSNTGLPQQVLSTIPFRKIWYDAGDTATALSPRAMSVTAGGYVYTFNGWVESTLTVPDGDVEFVGSWSVTPVSAGAGSGSPGGGPVSQPPVSQMPEQPAIPMR